MRPFDAKAHEKAKRSIAFHMAEMGFKSEKMLTETMLKHTHSFIHKNTLLSQEKFFTPSTIFLLSSFFFLLLSSSSSSFFFFFSGGTVFFLLYFGNSSVVVYFIFPLSLHLPWDRVCARVFKLQLKNLKT